jgi:tyrosine-protein phosphatase YwqE
MRFLFSGSRTNLIEVDLHSHLIPGVDDGSQSIDETLLMLNGLRKLGLKKCITTPHIYPELYPNKEVDLQKIYREVVKGIENEGIDIQLELAAEYYLHEELFKKLKQGVQLLTFGKKYILCETGFVNKPVYFEELIFELRTNGYRPVMAHPERYQYVAMDPNLLIQWKDQGILLQINSASLIGAFGPIPKKMARFMITNDLVSFVGSDLHHISQLAGFGKSRSDKWYRRACNGVLINHSLA